MNILFIVFLQFSQFFEINYEDESNSLLGSWRAEWSISKNNKFFLSSSKSSVMHGLISFDNKGSVIIQGFGYPDCLFSEDTIIYNTKWFVKNEQLIIGDKVSNQFYYNIKSIDSNKITMTILNDINLVLTK